MKKIIDEVKKLEKEFIEIRHQFHQNPEIGFEEKATSEFVANKLKQWGYTVYENVGKTGVVAQLKVGTGEKVIGIRADMDALPIQEEGQGKEWESKVPNRFHGCGHDGHTATLLCTAKYLAESKNFNGTVNLIFQPAEELLYGARVMIEDNFFDRFPCDYIFGFHNMPRPDLVPGDFYFTQGPMMASSDTVHIEITGKGCHGAQPENGIDATLVACYIGISLQSIVSRNISPFDQAVITIGCIEAGQAANVVNGKSLMKLSIRALRNEVRDKVIQRISEVAKLQAESFGATAEIVFVNACPALENPVDGFDLAVGVAEELYGKEKVHTDNPPIMGSEDFSFFFKEHPHGCYFYIGGKGEAPIHNPRYDFDDDVIVIGASYWGALVEKYLK